VGIFLAGMLLTGCRTFGDKKSDPRQEALKEKLENYAALQKALNEGRLTKGTAPDEIRASYGEPDDIFTSGSSASGRLEIWNYGKMISRGIDNWHPIRLYFSNNKLVDWNY
jgi:hypothetical protein